MIIGRIDEATGELQCTVNWHPPLLLPWVPEGLGWVGMDEHLVRKPPTPTTIPTCVERRVAWVETSTLPGLIAQGLDDVDTPAHQARAAVLVKQTQDIEYQVAERDAREYRAAGYSGEAGRGVSGWAAAKHRDNWTLREACDDILATADRWINLLYDIRDLRLAAKENIRHAVDGAEIAAIVNDFQAKLAAAMKVAANA